MPIWIKKISLIIIGIYLAMAALQARAGDNDFSADQRQAINQMIHDYILQYPEILPEAIQILQKRQKEMTLEKNHAALYQDGFSYVGGNKDGDVTLIEFFDYNCTYCKRSLENIEKLKKQDPYLRVIYKEFPILAQSSYTASKAAMAAMKQGKYQQFHIAMLQNSKKLTEKRIFEIARKVGLDEKQLVKDMTDPVLDRNIKINHGLAEAMGINGTPGFVIGNSVLSGALPYAELAKLIAKARQQKALDQAAKGR